jgi:hypothetical protein
MTFKKGQSGNPNGRPKGAIDRRLALRKILEDKSEELVKKAAEMALGGDAQVMRACLERLVPAYKSKDAAVVIDGPITGTLTEMGQKVMAALSSGELTPDEASILMQTISSQARIVEVDELERRLKTLESKIGGKNGH